MGVAELSVFFKSDTEASGDEQPLVYNNLQIVMKFTYRKKNVFPSRMIQLELSFKKFNYKVGSWWMSQLVKALSAGHENLS